MYTPEKLAENIRAIAKKNKISQKDLLLRCDLGVNTITRLSNGTDILTKNLVKFAEELDCSVDFLLGRSNFPDIQKKDISSEDLLFLKKLHSLPEDSQDEIIHMVNYKYEQYQKKRSRLSSTSGSATTNDSQDMLA